MLTATGWCASSRQRFSPISASYPYPGVVADDGRRLAAVMRHLLDHLVARCTYRRVHALDIDLAAVGDESWLIVHTGRRWWRRMVEVRVDRDELVLLADQIRDAEVSDPVR